MALVEVAGLPGASSEIDDAIKQYAALQQREDRVMGARARLGGAFPSLLGLFDLAEQKFQLAKSNAAQIPDAAAAMRSLLDKLKGELFDKARRGPDENMTWSVMAERLGGAEKNKQATLLDLEVSRGALYGDLSAFLKQRTALDMKRVTVTWMLFIDHVYAVCGCV
jgi:hypothetical protein